MAPVPGNGTVLPTGIAEEVGMCSKRLDRLTRAMQRYIDDELLAGTVTLVARKGKIVHFEALGHRHREADAPMPKDALFNIMSMTKPIVSTALMMLLPESKVDRLAAVYKPEGKGNKIALHVAPFFHVTVRPVATICATQAIIDSNSSKPCSMMGYEKLP